MDILSHGLWAVVAGKAAEPRLRRRLRYGWVFFWGAFPDLFAFGVPFIWMVWGLATGGLAWSDLPRPGQHGVPPDLGRIGFLDLAPHLYNWSHSLFVFACVFFLVWTARSGWRRPRRDRVPYALLAWLLHIVMDIPSHSLEFYPTPVLWPFSDWKFDGVVWGRPWFLAMNYSALAAVSLWLWYRARRRQARRE